MRSGQREPFAFRLFLGVALTLLAVGAATYALIDARIRGELLDDGAHSARAAAEADALLAAVRESMLVISLPALVGSLALFWLLAGRSLHARHRFAVQRAMRDGLTELGNHRAFQEELRRAASAAERNGLDFALAVLDVDDFKFLNDRRGHQQGDELLRRVARVLSGGTRAQDRAFRTGGDEFALLLPGTTEHEALAAARRLRRLVGESGLAISCGISATRPGVRSPVVVREEAEAALQEAKRRRSQDPVRYSEVSGQADILTPQKAHSVRLMVEHGALDAALQPIWGLEGSDLVGFEGLARPHSVYELAGPAEAFDVAEQIGRIADLDRLCVRRILEHAADLPGDARLFVNVHPASLEDEGNGADWLLDLLHRARVAPDRVVIEVTERSGARAAAVARSVERLREAGLRVALDDVGAGNSGLEMLHSVAVDYVKIDRSVVVRALTEVNARAVLAAIIAFAHESGTFVIAEGIEDDAMLEFVRGLEVHASGGIRGAQGYGLGRPAPTVAEAVARAHPPAVLRVA